MEIILNNFQIWTLIINLSIIAHDFKLYEMAKKTKFGRSSLESRKERETEQSKEKRKIERREKK